MPYTDVFLDKTSFLFMQVDRCITKYAKIAYLWIYVQFYKYSKIAYFRFYLGLFSFRIIMHKQGVKQRIDIGVTLGGFFFIEDPSAILVVKNVTLASIAWELIDRDGKHIAWLII